MRNPRPRHPHRCAASALAVFLISFSPASSPAQSRARRISFRTTVEVPDEGVRFPVPQGAQAVGLSPAQIHTYRDNQGRTVEMQDPRDFWYPSQFRGRWEDRSGTRMTLAVPSAVLPTQWSREHVRFEEYTQAATQTAPPRNDAELAGWVQTFAGAALRGEPEDGQPPPRLSRVRLFRFEGRAPQRLGIAFSFQPNPFGIDPDRWFFVLMEFEGAVDLDAVERDLPRGFLAGITPFTPRETSSAAAGRFQLHPAQAESTARSPLFEASRQRAIDSIRGLRNWWYVETPNYVLVSDLPGGRASIVRRVQGDVETLRSAFVALAPPRVDIDAVSVIRIFSDGSDYVAHVGQDKAQTGGVWMPGRGEMVIRPREWGSVQDQRAWLFEVVYHEAFHQYLHYAVGGRETSVWFNEGHATFFEGAEVRGDQIRIGEVARYAEIFTRLVSSGRLDFETLLTQSYPEFYGGGLESYARAWGLTYYLRKHAAQHPENPHAALPGRHLDALARGSTLEQATAEALGGESVQALEAAVTAFWQSSSARRAAWRFDPLAATP